ncbi:carbon-nitrogen hydrolase family protein [Pseudokineococcus lusitanus]|uniref:Putative amidohydrolase n=1 Tax=Pseudokineococcus lusitanus TaxID=763993 RepID=A0A3N1GAM2_9ACTN|nr:carbon-nitrogen hydrolase family protein [Pseudokineococcus lusitanus]ROP27293.1 putative amidohydrolase [Pseudokineococcus lusitanus]
MRAALVQMTSTDDPAANLRLVEERVTAAAERGATLVVLPEAVLRAFGGGSLAEVAEPLDGPWATAVTALARRLGVTVVVGTFTPAAGEGDARVRNTLLVTGPGGTTSYDKTHLFDAFGYAESDGVQPGSGVVVADVDGEPVGLATCYDVRFPALFTAAADRGARLVVVCASWGAGPGKVEQWELLVRARALDSTSVVVAVGQADAGGPVGAAPTGVGHSLVVSPLGEVLHRLGAEEDTLVVDLDLDAVDDARRVLPVLANRRRDLGV